MKILVIGEDLKLVSDELAKKGHSTKFCQYGNDGAIEMFMEKYDYIVTERDLTWFDCDKKREKNKYIELLEQLKVVGLKTPILVLAFHKKESLSLSKYPYAKQINFDASISTDIFGNKMDSDSKKNAKKVILDYFDAL